MLVGWLSRVWNILSSVLSDVRIWDNFWQPVKHIHLTQQLARCVFTQLLPSLIVCKMSATPLASEKRLPESVHHYPHLDDYWVSPLSMIAGFFPSLKLWLLRTLLPSDLVRWHVVQTSLFWAYSNFNQALPVITEIELQYVTIGPQTNSSTN